MAAKTAKMTMLMTMLIGLLVNSMGDAAKVDNYAQVAQHVGHDGQVSSANPDAGAGSRLLAEAFEYIRSMEGVTLQPGEKEYILHLAKNLPKGLSPTIVFQNALQPLELMITKADVQRSLKKALNAISDVGDAGRNTQYDAEAVKGAVRKFLEATYREVLRRTDQSRTMEEIKDDVESLNPGDHMDRIISALEGLGLQNVDGSKVNNFFHHVNEEKEKAGFATAIRSLLKKYSPLDLPDTELQKALQENFNMENPMEGIISALESLGLQNVDVVNIENILTIFRTNVIQDVLSNNDLPIPMHVFQDALRNNGLKVTVDEIKNLLNKLAATKEEIKNVVNKRFSDQKERNKLLDIARSKKLHNALHSSRRISLEDFRGILQKDGVIASREEIKKSINALVTIERNLRFRFDISGNEVRNILEKLYSTE